MTHEFAIETERLTKVYGSGNTEVIAMRDASMQVRRGEVVALLGPSGSGKSTFLTAVGLINPPTSGRVVIRGQLVLDGPTARVCPTFYTLCTPLILGPLSTNSAMSKERYLIA